MNLLKLYSWLKQPVPNNSIIIFRIVFSFCLLIQTYYFISEKFIEKNIIQPFTLFPFIKFIQPFSDFYFFNWLISPMILLSIIMLIANIGMLINKYSRYFTLLFLSCFTYFWLLDKGYFNNHYYFISIICFLILLTNQSSFSQNNYVPRIQLVSLQAMVVIIYFIAGVNKLNPYWLIDMQPVTHILETKYSITKNNFLINDIVIKLLTYGGLIYDLCIGFLLLIRNTKLLAFILVVVFNSVNFFLFNDVGEIGVFPLIMISTITLFVNPTKWNKFLKLNKTKSEKIKHHPIKDFLIISFILIQCILPFRHFLFNGYVDYNGIGQRFAWRMKTMYKKPYTAGVIGFDIYLKNHEYKEKIAHVNLYNLEDFADKYATSSMYLTQKQKTALLYYPDMLPIFCNQLEKVLKDYLSKKIQGNFDIIINAQCEIGFMGRESQEIINSKIDLTAESSRDVKTWLYKLK